MSDEFAAVFCWVLPLAFALGAIYSLSYSRFEMVNHLRRVFRRWRYCTYLRSPEWATRRKAVLKRAGYKCEACGCDARLDVHHLTYAHFRRERLDELQALCRPCHIKADAARRLSARRERTLKQINI